MNLISNTELSDSEVMDFLANQESQDVKSVGQFRDALMYRLDNPIAATGIKLPFPRTHDQVRLRESEVSVWFGKSGHFKSSLVNQVALYATQEVKVGIMSFEMPVDVTLQRMTMQAAGSGSPDKSYAHDLVDYLTDRMWIYDHLDMVEPARALACVHHMAKLGIKLVVLDCLIMVKGITRDAEKEAEFMGHLTALAKVHGIHIALVHHSRKGDTSRDPNRMPTRDDMRGASDLGDMASMIVIVHHNKPKKLALLKQEKNVPLSDDEVKALDQACQYMSIDKARNSPFEGIVGLTMHREAIQFRESPNQKLFLDIPRKARAVA